MDKYPSKGKMFHCTAFALRFKFDADEGAAKRWLGLFEQPGGTAKWISAMVMLQPGLTAVQ
jgi:hypothetical protein